MGWLENMQGGPAVDVVGVFGARVMFQTEREFPLGKVAAVRLVLSERKFRARVLVQNVRGRPRGGFVYTCRSDTRLPEVGGAGAFGGSRGSLPRLPCRIRVCSSALPHYQVMSVDFSSSGLDVESLAPVALGQVIPLSLHIGMEDLPILECKARVTTCKLNDQGGCLVGLDFWETDPWTRGHLDRFQELLADRGR
ncbi:MAG: PilZ domain-containing protein [Armatimonadetes bacterium]|nr:PilZ domain-containing protein [Armatimonadota bacterium]